MAANGDTVAPEASSVQLAVSPGAELRFSGPPKAYHFGITVAGKTKTATAYVPPTLNVRIDPKQITVLVGADTSIVQELTITNAGNVPVSSGPRCKVPLYESYDLIGTLIDGLHNTKQASIEQKVQSFLTQVI